MVGWARHELPVADAAARSESEWNLVRHESTRKYLEDYWGAEWPEVLARLEKKGKYIDGPFEIGDWQEAVPTILSQLTFQGAAGAQQVDMWVRWKQELTKELLTTRFEFEPPIQDWELEEVRAKVNEFNSELEELAQKCLQATNEAIAGKFESGNFLKSPFSTACIDRSRLTRAFCARGGGFLGWSVEVRLEHADHPDLVALRRELKGLAGRRDSWLVNRARSR